MSRLCRGCGVEASRLTTRSPNVKASRMCRGYTSRLYVELTSRLYVICRGYTSIRRGYAIAALYNHLITLQPSYWSQDYPAVQPVEQALFAVHPPAQLMQAPCFDRDPPNGGVTFSGNFAYSTWRTNGVFCTDFWVTLPSETVMVVCGILKMKRRLGATARDLH